MIDINALVLAGLKQDGVKLSLLLPEVISELRRLQEVERQYDKFLKDTLDVTAAVMREFPGSTLSSSIAR